MMMKLQKNVFDSLAEQALPKLVQLFQKDVA